MIKPKKSLGQNFLIDKNIIKKITSIANIQNKNVLEIGTGTGNLTKSIIASNPKHLTVVEKDNKLIDYLKNNFDFNETKVNNTLNKLNI